MKQIDIAGLASDPVKRFEFLSEFVGLTDDERGLIAESMKTLGPRLPEILNTLYDKLMSYDDTRRVFLGTDGEVDPNYMAIRREHLTNWVLAVAEPGKKEKFAKYVMSVGKRHTSSEGEKGRNVPPRYMVAFMSLIQTGLLTALFEEIGTEQPKKALQMGMAWSKVLMVQLEMILKECAPHWPAWDEQSA